MRELPAGADAVLLDFATDSAPAAAVSEAAAAVWHAVGAGTLPHVTDVIASAHTLLVQAEHGRGIDILGIHRALRAGRLALGDEPAGDRADVVSIPVVYDGPDLADVAALLGVDEDDVVGIHQETVWRVQFMGFAPGFGYLVPHDDPDHMFRDIGRRAESRTRVPVGAVAIAAGYSAVYPRESPGGWHLLGRTAATVWDERSDPPALLEPGRLVRFIRADPGPDPS